MYDVRPNLIIGFHGCDEAICHSLINNPDNIQISQQPFDWLGHGMYFWENNYERALSWALEKQRRGKINKSAVIGAIISLGNCCDFLDSKNTRILESNYFQMKSSCKKSAEILPENKDVANDEHKDKLLRYLDCAVIEFMHKRIDKKAASDVFTKGFSDYQLFDSVRGAFMEGGPAFKGSDISKKSHIQIAIRNPNCIKGFFLPRREVNYAKWYGEKFHTTNTHTSVN
jgi:hypothetical protein